MGARGSENETVARVYSSGRRRRVGKARCSMSDDSLTTESADDCLILMIMLTLLDALCGAKY